MGKQKNLCITYFLWLLFGWFGVHHFYLRRDRQAFLWWSTLGGVFFLGWIRDIWRIPKYVDDANEDTRYMDELVRKMRLKDYPKFSVIRFSGELLVGFFYGFLTHLALPAEMPKPISMILVCAGITTGVHLVGNIGREKGEFLKPFLGSLICYFILSVIGDGPNYMYCSTVATLTFNYLREHRRIYKPASFGHRTLRISFCMVLFSSLWISFLYFNAEITTEVGDKVKFRDSVSHFFRSPAWLEFTQTLNVIYEEGRKNGWKNVYDEFVKALDPKGEANAYKVLGLNSSSTEVEIKKAYKTLVRQWHPDRYHDPVEKEVAQEEFIGIQKAYEILTNKKKSDSRDFNFDRAEY